MEIQVFISRGLQEKMQYNMPQFHEVLYYQIILLVP